MNKATTVFRSARIRTGPDWEPVVTSIVVVGDKITYVGDDREAIRIAGEKAELIDRSGEGTFYPGIVEAHAHIYGTGERALMPRLEGVESVELIKQKLAKIVEHEPTGNWIVARGWDQNLWHGAELPNAADLKSLGEEHPIALTRIDGHALWCNHTALELAGITRGTHDPKGGLILRDGLGEPTGLLLDEAMKFVESLIPPPTLFDVIRTLRTGLHEFAKHGHVAVHDMGVSGEVFDALVELYRIEGDSLPHAWVFLDMHKQSGRHQFLEWMHQQNIPNTGHERLHFAGIKIYLDGALGSRGAELFEPYRDDPGNRGLHLSDDVDVIHLMKLAGEHRLQIAVHAIGDAANSRALHLFEQSGAGRMGATLRIEHAQIVRHSDLKHFQHDGVHAVVQPAFYESDRLWAVERLGSDRMPDAYRWASFLRHNVNLVASSDSPVESPDALHGMHLLVSRCGAEDSESLTIPEAFNAYCRNAHQLTQESLHRGAIEAGMFADLTLVRERHLTAPPKVLGTMVSGRWIYQADDESELWRP